MADYDINAVTRRVVYSGASGLGPYAFAFEILEQTDVVAYFNATKLTLTTDYTVTINSNGTGSVNIVTGGSVPSTPTASDQVVLVGSRDIERTTDFVTAGELRASALNEQLDSLTIFDQQLAEENKRTIRAPVYDPALVEDGGVVDMTLPEKASRAGKTLAFDDDGNPVVGEDIGNWRGDWAASVAYDVRDLVRDPVDLNIYRVNTAHTSSGVAPLTGNADYAKFDLVIDAASAADAEAAQLAAEAARDAAQLAQAAAETAETNAELAETNAATSETNAATSETNAATSEANAATSETNAATSETNAAASASSASSSASTATTKASEAATSETNAATSETNAATSATNAATSEFNAGTSAASALASEGSASASASSAAVAQTAAEAARDSALAAFDNFDDKYLGEKASDPTLDNDGDALVAGALYFNTTDDAMKVYNGTSWVDAYADGATLVSKSGDTMTGNLSFGDNDKAIFGAGSDLQIYHDGSHSNITDAGTGNLRLQGNNLVLQNSDATKSYSVAVNGGAIDLRHNNSVKLATTPTGINVTGNATFDDNGKAVFGAGSDLEILHDGTNSVIRDNGTGNLSITTNGSKIGFYDQANTQFLAEAFTGGGFRLYYDGSQKFVTQPNGVKVTGNVVSQVGINAQTGTTYTTVLADQSKLVTLNNASAIALTIPANSSVAYPVGTQIDLSQFGAGQVTVAGASGVTVNSASGLKLRAQYSSASCVKVDTDTWLLVGDLEA